LLLPLPLLLPFYSHYTEQPASAGTQSQELEDFLGAKFYSPHALVAATSAFGLGRRVLLNGITCTLSIP